MPPTADIPDRAVQWPAAAAGAASVAIAVTSWWVAAVPKSFPAAPPLPYVGYYLALAVLIGSWLGLGRCVLEGRAVPATLTGYLLAAAVPLLGAAPFGRDLWAYAAQGHLTGTGLDPYTHGPEAAAGVFSDQMSHIWVNTPSPYGPVWLRISQFGAWISDAHPTVAALVLRLPAFAGLLLAWWALRRLAGRRLTVAVWLGLANPLLLVLGLGGGHNDLEMLGLILAAVAIATGRARWSLLAAGMIAGVAILIKSPAAIAVPFLVPVWLQANRVRPTLRQIATSCVSVATGAAVALAALSAACGLGTGWISAVGPDAKWVSWLSLPTGAAMLVKLATGSPGGLRVLDGTIKAFRTAGEALTVVGAATLWVLALRGRNAIGCLALALGLAATLAPSVQPWYYCWGIALAALIALPRLAMSALAAVTVGFTVMVTPAGHGWESDWRGPVVLAGAALVAWLALRRSAPDDDRPDRARPEVRADHRAQFGHV